MDNEKRNPIDFRSWGQRFRSTLVLCVWNLVDTIQTAVLVLSLSNFTCMLLKTKRGILLILGHRSRLALVLCIKPFGHDTDYGFSLITFKIHMQVVEDEKMNPIDFGSWDHWSRSNFTWKLLKSRRGTVLILVHGVKGRGQLWYFFVWNLVGTIQTTVLVKSLSNFICKFLTMRRGTVSILGNRIKCLLCPPPPPSYEGMPRLPLSS